MPQRHHSPDAMTQNTSQLEFYQSVLDAIPDAIVVHQAGRIRFANAGAVQLMALPDHCSPIDREIWPFFHDSMIEQVQTSFHQLATCGSVGAIIPTMQHTMVRYDGTVFTGEIRSILIRDGDPPVIMSLTRDVSSENALRSQLEHIAYHDTLTGLPNRAYFSKMLQRWMDDPITKDGRHAVLFLDFDGFKKINDTYGHRLGDEALLAMGARLQSVLLKECFLARMGGDEFAILCPNVVADSTVESFGQTILRAFSNPLVVSHRDFIMAPSIGIAVYPDEAMDSESLIAQADLAMYSAKRRGGNRIHLYQPEERTVMEERIRLEDGLRAGFERNEFLLCYQPKIHLPTRELESLEALIRWQPSDAERIPPDKFIPIAEECGLMVPLGEWVLREACQQNKMWQDMGYKPIRVSVNVSPKQFQCIDMAETIRQVLEETHLSPEWLEIEITEGLLMPNSAEITHSLRRIRAMGVRIAVDDFGTGYSSLKYLRQFEPNTLKIDQSFVATMLKDSGQGSIVSAIIQLAHSLGMDVVAEGVESEEQSRRLLQEGCDIAQGYFFSPPVSAEIVQMQWLQLSDRRKDGVL